MPRTSLSLLRFIATARARTALTLPARALIFARVCSPPTEKEFYNMTTELVAPAWTIPGYLAARGHTLRIDSADALELIKKFGSPLYVFSEPRIRANVARLQRAARIAD